MPPAKPKAAKKLPSKNQGKGQSPELTAKAFIADMMKHQSNAELEKIQRYFKSGAGEYGEGDRFMGIRMGTVFALAKKYIDMPPAALEKLLDNPVHEIRAGALSIMDKQARRNSTPEARRKELYDLYIRRHDRVNNWDLVDVSAIHVVGSYLHEKPRDILFKLARSKNIWERRTAIVSTAYFIKKGDVSDTFKIAALLVKDKEDLIHKAAGGWIRQAGKSHPKELLSFLDKHAATLPRTFLRYAIEHLSKKQKEHYMGLA